uniref:Uncharacterized protein n=1 Tax=Chrysotila carterae TaxID=13221 RepID=A0A7S4EY18_CHRCT
MNVDLCTCEKRALPRRHTQSCTFSNAAFCVGGRFERVKLRLPSGETHNLPHSLVTVCADESVGRRGRCEIEAHVLAHSVSVDQQPRCAGVHVPNEPRKRLHHQRRAHYKKQVAIWEVVACELEEPSG